MKPAQIYEVALSLIPGIGNVLAKHLVSYCGSPENVFKKPKGKLIKIPGIGPKTAEAIANSGALKEAEAELYKAEKQGVQALFYTSPLYPKRLKNIVNAPILLYFKGNAPLNCNKVLSIVGTRRATEYGKHFIDQLLSDLQNMEDLLIVSGLAYGIDIQAHKSSLQNKIPTIGVMANGLDIVYPADHKEIALRMLQNGGLLTENRLGVMPDPPKFPERNRIIAGMADGVLVVEAAKSGGALITAEIANSFDIEVFALPGGINQKYSEGCNNLIKTHKAHLISSAEDIIKLLNWDVQKSETKKKLTLMLNPEEQTIYDLLVNKQHQIDELSYKSQIPIGKLPVILLELEIKGIVKALPGQKYCLL